MKVKRRSVPLDMLAVEQRGKSITISTCHHRISLAAYDGMEQVAWHEFTFDQLYRLLNDLKPGIADLCDMP